MKCLFLIFILPSLLLMQNDTSAQQDKVGVVLYASKDDIKPKIVESNTALDGLNDKSIATIPFEGAYYESYYGTENLNVYAGEEIDRSLVYIKITTPVNTPVSVTVTGSKGETIASYAVVNHPLVIGYGYKPGIYLIHICQGKKEMVLRFSKGV